jgi:sec-independent protein translocase protein TatC
MRKLLRLVWRILTLPFRWARNVSSEIRQFLTEVPEDTPLSDSIQKAVENPGDILVHLNALRKHIFRAMAVFILITIVSLAFATRIVDFLAQPVGGMSELVAIDPTEPISTIMRVSLLTGFAISFPYIALELWLFAAPGLAPESRLVGLAAIPLATLFFLAGMAFAFFVFLPTAVPFLVKFGGFTTQVRPASYIKFVTGIMFWIGVAFEFPLIIYVLARIGLVRGKVLAEQWRLAIVIMAVMSAMITPTVDPISMMLVMGPMIALYFLSIGLALMAERTRRTRRRVPQT